MEGQNLEGCDVCGQDHETEDCPILAEDEEPSQVSVSRARLTLPASLMEVIDHPAGTTSVITKETLNPKRRFGPYEAKRTTQKVEMDVGFILKVLMKDGGAVWLDTTEENSCNWLCLVRTADSVENQNLMAVQLGTDIFYITTKVIEPGTELRVWYAPHYARKLGRTLEPDGKTQALLGHNLVVAAPEVVMFVESQGSGAPNEQINQVNLLNSDRHSIVENLESLGLNWSTIHNLLNESNAQAETQPTETQVVIPQLPKLAAPRGALVKHRENEEGPRVCGKCNATFDSLQELALHTKIHLKVSESKSAESERGSGKKRGRGRPKKHKTVSPADTPTKRSRVDIAPNVVIAKDQQAIQESEQGLLKEDKMHEIKIVDVSNVLSVPDIVEENSTENITTVIDLKRESAETTVSVESGEGIVSTEQASNDHPTEIVVYVSDEFGLGKTEHRILTAGLSSKEEDNLEFEEDHEELLESNDPDYVPTQTYSERDVTSSPTNLLNTEESLERGLESSAKPDETTKPAIALRRGRRGQITKNCALIFDDCKRVMYRCNHCPLCFSKLEMFSRHLEESHKALLVCPGCSKQFDTLDDLSCHTCEDDSTSPTLPHASPRTQRGKQQADRSQKTKTTSAGNEEEEEGKIHKCDICEKTFERLKYLKRHLRGHTNMFHCSKCNKRFVRKETLQTHNCDQNGTRTVSDEAAYVCEFCGISFSKQKYLLRHMAAHTGEFRCNSCNREFSRKESLLQHIKKFHPSEIDQTKEKVFPCDQCNRVFSREMTLQNHMKLHKGTHTCDTCGRSFASAFSLEKHTCGCVIKTDNGYSCKACSKTFTAEPAALRHQALHSGDFTCQICNCPFSRKELLNQHLLVCTAIMQSETSGEIVCNVCEKNFPDAASFRLHYREHTHPYKCDTCDQKFLRITNLKKHQCKAVTGENTVECQICKKKFRHERFLQRHMVLHNAPKYHCQQCNRKFGRIDFYNDHMCIAEDGMRVRIQRNTRKADLIPSTDAQAICPTCGKSYSSVSNLNKHMKTHGEKKEICDICNKTFHLKIALREHMESVHTEVFKHQCQYCGKFLKCRNSMFGHVRQFHSEVIIMYECEQCGKQFRQKGNLKKHILTHSTKKTFECGECSKKFKFPDQLKRHELWHTHGERFECEFCNKKFVMQFELRKHQQTYHSGVMYVCEYCFTECRHAHTMKRHLQRRHSNEREWQTNTAEYIKALIPRRRLQLNAEAEHLQVAENAISQVPSNTVAVGEVAEAVQIPDASTLAAQLQAQIQDPNLPLSEQPFIVAEVSGLSGGDQEGTQTVIIQTTGGQFDNEMMSQEVAAALRSLTKRGSLEESTFAIIQNLPSENTEQVNVQMDLQDESAIPGEKPFIVVPMMNTENNEDAINVFNNDIVQDQIYTQPS